jgi:hypothetical protein
MTVINKRNAILGWGVWQVGKVAAKRKAKQSLEPKDKGRTGKGAGAILSALAAAGGALWFWRRRRGDNDES